MSRVSGSSSKKGKVAEYLISALCLNGGGGRLNVAVPIVDDEGVDMVVFRREVGEMGLFLQVKARGSLSESVQSGGFLIDVRAKTFSPSPNYYVLGVTIDEVETALGKTAWLVPSAAFEKRAARTKGGDILRMNTSAKANDKWAEFRIFTQDLPGKLLELLGAG